MDSYAFITQEQRDFITILRDILDKELAPIITEYDEKNEYPMHVHRTLCEAGFNSVTIPNELGGLGMDMVTYCLIGEEMARYDAGFAFSFNAANGILKAVYAHGTDEQKKYCTDRILNDGAISCTCITEAEAGSDAAAMRTTAVRDGDEYVLNGTKTFISNGGIADMFLVLASTDRSKGAKGISMFIVEKRHGVQAGKHEDKLGIRLSDTSEVIFDDVRIPASNLIGEEGMGFKYVMQFLDTSRPFTMVYAVGLAQRALELSIEYAKVRKTFGQPIIANQGVNFMLADMEAQIQAARQLIFYAARMVDAGIPLGSLSPVIKTFASEMAVRVTEMAVQIHGGYGYCKDYPVEKLYRDAKIFTIFEGTNQIQRMVLSRHLAKRQ